jgi:Arc/MetJ-type ribon-helix-helix transcriptional regulator
MPKRSTGARFHLGEPWESTLEDFCAAHFAASATQVIRAALEAFIKSELARDRATAERFEALQARRESDSGGKT